MFQRRWLRIFSLTFVLFYLCFLLTPFVGSASADYTPPNYEPPKNNYQVPEDLYIAPESPYTVPEKYKPGDQQHIDQKNNGYTPNTSGSSISPSERKGLDKFQLYTWDSNKGFFENIRSNLGLLPNVVDTVKGVPSIVAGINNYKITPTKLPYPGPRYGNVVSGAESLKNPILSKLNQLGRDIPTNEIAPYMSKDPRLAQYMANRTGLWNAVKGGGVGLGAVLTPLANYLSGQYDNLKTWEDYTANIAADVAIGAGSAAASAAAGWGAVVLTSMAVGSTVPVVGTVVGLAAGIVIASVVNSEWGQKYIRDPLVKAAGAVVEGGKKVVNAVADGAKKAGKAVSNGIKKGGKAVAKGLKKVGKGISSLFGR